MLFCDISNSFIEKKIEEVEHTGDDVSLDYSENSHNDDSPDVKVLLMCLASSISFATQRI